MWSHAQFIEMINHIPIANIKRPYSFIDVSEWVSNAGKNDYKAAFMNLQLLIESYQENVNDVPWKEFYMKCGQDESVNSGDKLLAKMRFFWEMVHFQFMNSSRKSAAERYRNGLAKFAHDNFCKQRGPLGYTLSLNREQLLFLSRLCIGREPRLRLVALWKEFERRGVKFDFDSKQKIVVLFEKLNLLEKKSDSGDAQYVRAIF
jgi:DNA phosphorothioation-dependent restriction protein DptG